MTISLHSPFEGAAVSPRHTSVRPDIRENARRHQFDATGSVAGKAITENVPPSFVMYVPPSFVM
jgi:hypothetical protein